MTPDYQEDGAIVATSVEVATMDVSGPVRHGHVGLSSVGESGRTSGAHTSPTRPYPAVPGPPRIA